MEPELEIQKQTRKKLLQKPLTGNFLRDHNQHGRTNMERWGMVPNVPSRFSRDSLSHSAKTRPTVIPRIFFDYYINNLIPL